MNGWRPPAGEMYSFLTAKFPVHLGRSDIVLNILVYMPVGLLFFLALRNHSRSFFMMVLATSLGTLLSFSMESLQVFLPSRTPSVIDLITNSMGTFFGVVLGHLSNVNTFTGQRLITLRNKYFLDGSWVNMGLIVIGLWSLMHLSPIVVTLDIGKIHEGLAPVWHVLQDPSLFGWYSFFATFSFLIGLSIIVRQIVRPERSPVVIFFYFSLAVLLAKIFIVSRQVSLEQIIALFAATLFASRFSNTRTNAASRMAIVSICIGYVISQLAPGVDALSYSSEFNWIPFNDQNATLNGISSILENIWPFMAMAYLLHISIQEYQRSMVIIAGGFFVVFLTFSMEWIQQYIPGRTADISAVLVALIGWIIPLSNRLNFSHNPTKTSFANPENLSKHRSRSQP